MAAIAPSPSEPISSSGRWEIADQLSKVLVSPWFRSSSRCSQLLRHVVELSLYGQEERLRERQIAVEIFHRKPTYDNNLDPVVRVAAGEVRKRLAQYYGTAENAGQIRIELPIGSYVPSFHFPVPAAPLAEVAQPAAEPEEQSSLTQESIAGTSEAHEPGTPVGRRSWAWIALVAAAIFVACAWGVWRRPTPSPHITGFDAFWAPLLTAQSSPLISVGELHSRELTFVPDRQRSPNSEAFDVQVPRDESQGIPVERIGYLQAVAKIASVLGAKEKPFDFRDQSETTFADFAGRPTILLGAYENDWSMGLSQGRRFEFQADYARGRKWISDRLKPGQEIGSLPTSSPAPTSYDAYSIVMRDTGAVSRQSRILLAGVGDEGTVAAAEFASNPKYLDEFARHLPTGWAGKNIEILIRTRIVEGVLGIPTVVDYSIW